MGASASGSFTTLDVFEEHVSRLHRHADDGGDVDSVDSMALSLAATGVAEEETLGYLGRPWAAGCPGQPEFRADTGVVIEAVAQRSLRCPEASSGSNSSVMSLEVLGDSMLVTHWSLSFFTPPPPPFPFPTPPPVPPGASQFPMALPIGSHGNASLQQGGLGT